LETLLLWATAAENAISDLTLEQWALLLPLLLGAGALYYSRKAARASRSSAQMAEKALKVSEEQLDLARAQESRHPSLEVLSFELLEPGTVPEILEAERERGKWQQTLRSYEQTKARWDEEQREKEREKERRPFDSLTPRFGGIADQPPIDPNQQRYFMAGKHMTHIERQDYDGPRPDKVVRIVMVNRGSTAAKGISGRFRFDGDRLRPIEYPELHGEVRGRDEDGSYTVEVADGRTNLQPYPHEEDEYRIAVLVGSTGICRIGYSFTTAEGHEVEGKLELEVPG
jgi:hypothetical protein